MSLLVFCEEKGSDVKVVFVEAPWLLVTGTVSTGARLAVVVVVVVVVLLLYSLLDELEEGEFESEEAGVDSSWVLTCAELASTERKVTAGVSWAEGSLFEEVPAVPDGVAMRCWAALRCACK